jgi:hypothetical protein
LADRAAQAVQAGVWRPPFPAALAGAERAK